MYYTPRRTDSFRTDRMIYHRPIISQSRVSSHACNTRKKASSLLAVIGVAAFDRFKNSECRPLRFHPSRCLNVQ